MANQDLSLNQIWPFSSYAPNTDVYPPVVLLQGFDYSFEEMRLEYYKNRQAYVQQEAQMVSQVTAKKEEMKRDMRRVLDQYQERVNAVSIQSAETTNAGLTGSAFGKQSGFLKPATSTFRTGNSFSALSTEKPVSAFSQTVSSALGKQPQASAFGQTSSSFGQSAFGQSNQSSAFGKPAQTAFGQTNQQPVKSAFGQATSSSAFGQPYTSTFGQSSFGLQPSTTSAFGKSTSAFGNNSQTASTFGQVSTPASTIAQSSFGQTAFGQQPSTTSAFAKPTPAFGAQTASTFGQTSTSASSFGQSAFKPQPITTAPVLGHSSFNTSLNQAAPLPNTFNQNTQKESVEFIVTTALPPDHLIEKVSDDIWQQPHFEFGKIPEQCPPLSLC